MKILVTFVAFVLLAGLAGPVCGAATDSGRDPQRFDFGRFGTVNVYVPQRDTPASVVLFVSGDGGWHLGVVRMAQELRAAGALVVGIDVRRYLAALGRGERCNDLAVDFEALGHAVQKKLALHDYVRPMLVGYSSGATIVYATLAQAPPGTFAGAISLGFCADQDMGGAPLCPTRGLHYTVGRRGEFIFSPSPQLSETWIALQGQKDQVCDPRAVDAFAAAIGPRARVLRLPEVGHGFGVERHWLPQLLEAHRELATDAEAPRPSATALRDLPLIEVAAEAAARAPGNALALLLSGDGGWAGLDREVSARLAADGIPVIGLDSLRYFWRARTPEEAARDVERALRHYLALWHKERIVLVGYSFGADVLPFVAARLPGDLRERVAALAFLGLSATASFEIHVADWIPGIESGGLPVQPEFQRLRGLPMLCLFGDGERDTLCPRLTSEGVTAEQIGRGHHLGGEYGEITRRIVERAFPGAEG